MRRSGSYESRHVSNPTTWVTAFSAADRLSKFPKGVESGMRVKMKGGKYQKRSNSNYRHSCSAPRIRPTGNSGNDGRDSTQLRRSGRRDRDIDKPTKSPGNCSSKKSSVSVGSSKCNVRFFENDKLRSYRKLYAHHIKEERPENSHDLSNMKIDDKYPQSQLLEHSPSWKNKHKSLSWEKERPKHEHDQHKQHLSNPIQAPPKTEFTSGTSTSSGRKSSLRRGDDPGRKSNAGERGSHGRAGRKPPRRHTLTSLDAPPKRALAKRGARTELSSSLTIERPNDGIEDGSCNGHTLPRGNLSSDRNSRAPGSARKQAERFKLTNSVRYYSDTVQRSNSSSGGSRVSPKGIPRNSSMPSLRAHRGEVASPGGSRRGAAQTTDRRNKLGPSPGGSGGGGGETVSGDAHQSLNQSQFPSFHPEDSGDGDTDDTAIESVQDTLYTTDLDSMMPHYGYPASASYSAKEVKERRGPACDLYSAKESKDGERDEFGETDDSGKGPLLLMSTGTHTGKHISIPPIKHPNLSIQISGGSLDDTPPEASMHVDHDFRGCLAALRDEYLIQRWDHYLDGDRAKALVVLNQKTNHPSSMTRCDSPSIGSPVQTSRTSTDVSSSSRSQNKNYSNDTASICTSLSMVAVSSSDSAAITGSDSGSPRPTA